MKPGFLQKLVFFALLIVALVFGVFVASAFLILGLLLVPVFLLRVYLQRKAFQKAWQKQKRQANGAGAADFSSSEQRGKTRGTVIEGEIVDKD
ncbi:hypothetical protein CWE12_12880 [Aliidiomarina sedimenti]|uniref:Uncharacterized protein n=1 Tax=Aliidiomarina sedimenti TaxID=1933879 RepID=A0ABY0BV03_9GAMM|nr:hypothetical protein [Aliidiomarina sedimenti]RUO28109.1 hypothetical protein CWE12_12880 [Aliidiomarina sedimenti]